MLHKTLILIAGAAVLAACTPAEPPRDVTEIVAERAQARWDAVIAGEHESAYAYYTPGYREQTSAIDYTIEMRGRPVQWMDADVGEVACEDDRCTVVTEVEYRVPSAPAQLSGMGSRRPVEETWIRIDGNWWFVPGS